MFEKVIDELTDNYIAIAVITTALAMAIMQINVPEWLILLAGIVIKFYFDGKA